MTGVDELLAFVRQQLDEDERVALKATAGPWRYNPTQHHREPGTARFSEGVFTGPTGRDAICVATTGETDDPPSMADAAHIARWDPDRVLAKVKAERWILDECENMITGWTDEETKESGRDILKLLAQPYAGQPGWREEWRV